MPNEARVVDNSCRIGVVFRCASADPRPNKHKKEAYKHADSAERATPIPTPPMVPLSIYVGTRSALIEALSALHAEQEARAKETSPQYEPWYAPAVLAQFGLLIVGAIYSFVACKQLKAIGTQSDIAKNASRAAEKSADAAIYALRIDRPYLILEHAELTGVLQGDNPVFKEEKTGELQTPPRFFPRVVLNFRNYEKGPVIFGEGLIRIDALQELPPARDFSGCKGMILQANAVAAGDKWHPLAQFNYDVDWTSLFPEIAAGTKRLIAYGCLRYTDPVGIATYDTGFCWIFVPPQDEVMEMPKIVKELLGPYRAPDAPDPETPLTSRMPGYFTHGPASHNYTT